MKLTFNKAKIYLLDIWEVLKAAGSSFSDNNSIKLSASLSYYTIFSIAPMMIVIIAMLSIFYGQEAIEGKLYSQIDGLIGKDAAKQVQELIKNANQTDQSVFASIIGIITLLLGATGIFLEIQGSINDIWSLKTKPKKGLLKFFLSRLVSFSMVLSLGFLLLVSLILNSLVEVLFSPLERILQGITIYIIYAVNIAATFIVITLLIGAIFKILPDGKLRLKDAAIGASFTALLFMLGKFLIGLYLSHFQDMSLYGSASSVVLILLWVYYCSIILYFGAEFTRAYATKFGDGITPKSYAILVETNDEEVMKGEDVKEPDTAGIRHS